LRPPKVEVIGVTGIPIVKPGDDVPRLIVEAAERQGTPIQDGDIVVVSHIIVSRAEGRIVNLNTVKPSKFAENIAKALGKDPRLVEVILQESRSIVRMGNGHLITETKHGFVCANSGVDQSNVPGEGFVALLPEDPDESARRIRDGIEKLTGKRVAVVVSDTHGRPLRDGEINVAIGVSGLKPIRDRRGERDLFGYVLKVKRTAVADEIASAAELVVGQADEGVPVAIVRGYRLEWSEEATARELIMPRERDLFA